MLLLKQSKFYLSVAFCTSFNNTCVTEINSQNVYIYGLFQILKKQKQIITMVLYSWYFQVYKHMQLSFS